MKKNYLWSLLTFIMVAMMSCGFAACGGDDDGGGGNSYNLTDDQAVSTLQGTWNVNINEHYEGEEDDNSTETWVVKGNDITITEGKYSRKVIFTIKNGVITLGDPVYFDKNNEKHRFIRLTSSSFETSDAEFNDGKICIKMVGTKK